MASSWQSKVTSSLVGWGEGKSRQKVYNCHHPIVYMSVTTGAGRGRAGAEPRQKLKKYQRAETGDSCKNIYHAEDGAEAGEKRLWEIVEYGIGG